MKGIEIASCTQYSVFSELQKNRGNICCAHQILPGALDAMIDVHLCGDLAKCKVFGRVSVMREPRELSNGVLCISISTLHTRIAACEIQRMCTYQAMQLMRTSTIALNPPLDERL